MEIPRQLTDEWLWRTVPDLSEGDLAYLLGSLRERGWREEEIERRVLAWRRAPETILETTAGTRAPPTVPLAGGPLLASGTELAGFVIEHVAGRGGMGIVYRARQLRPQRTVALKVIAPELAADDDYRDRFLRESELAASIEQSNVIPVFEVGDEDGLLFIAMRYVDGTDLGAAIAAEGRLEPRRAAQVVAQVGAALDAAHARGLVHRDVKPANILLTREGDREHVYLTDFGLAKLSTASGVTRTGLFVGTIDYAAPEQFEGDRIDARTDIYAAGCVLYQSLTGSLPFPAATEAAKLWGHLKGDPPSVRTADPSLPAELDDVIARAMAKDPEERYRSGSDLGRAALAAAEGRSAPPSERTVARGRAAPEPTVIASKPEPKGRRLPLKLIGLFLAPVAALGVIAAVVVLTRGGPKPAPNPGPSAAAFVNKVDRILSVSRGTLQAVQNDPGNTKVLTQRRVFLEQAVTRVEDLQPPAGFGPARSTLIKALRKSAKAEDERLNGNASAALADDRAATSLKSMFVTLWKQVVTAKGLSVSNVIRTCGSGSPCF